MLLPTRGLEIINCSDDECSFLNGKVLPARGIILYIFLIFRTSSERIPPTQLSPACRTGQGRAGGTKASSDYNSINSVWEMGNNQLALSPVRYQIKILIANQTKKPFFVKAHHHLVPLNLQRVKPD